MTASNDLIAAQKALCKLLPPDRRILKTADLHQAAADAIQTARQDMRHVRQELAAERCETLRLRNALAAIGVYAVIMGHDEVAHLVELILGGDA